MPEETPAVTTPELEVLKITPATAYSVEKGFKLPENIHKGIIEKDGTISRYADENKRLKAQLERRSRETESNEDGRNRGVEISPYDDPAGFRRQLKDELRGEMRVEQRSWAKRDEYHLTELQQVGALGGNDMEKSKVIFQTAIEMGLADKDEETGEYYLKPHAAKLAYRYAYFDKAIETAEKKGLETVGQELENAQRAPASAPAKGVGEAPVDWAKIAKTDPARYSAELAKRSKKSDELLMGTGKVKILP